MRCINFTIFEFIGVSAGSIRFSNVVLFGAATCSISLMICFGFSDVITRLSIIIEALSGTTFGAIPPFMTPIFNVARPSSLCERRLICFSYDLIFGITAVKRSIAFIPSSGALECAVFPFAVISNQYWPLLHVISFPFVGSIVIEYFTCRKFVF